MLIYPFSNQRSWLYEILVGYWSDSIRGNCYCSQRKYAYDILEVTAFVDSPMNPNQKLMMNQGETFSRSKEI